MCYFVAAPRVDGTAPPLEKVSNGRFFLIFDDAKDYCEHLSERVGYTYKVFLADVLIPRRKPITKEIKSHNISRKGITDV